MLVVDCLDVVQPVSQGTKTVHRDQSFSLGATLNLETRSDELDVRRTHFFFLYV